MTHSFDPRTYGPDVAAVLLPQRLPELGPGVANTSAHAAIASLTIDRMAGDREIHDPDMARCCLSALWLYHDFLDESHAISQEIDTPAGGYWHGIMHRREPDADNAKYWFRRVGTHPIFDALAIEAGLLKVRASGVSGWDPFEFVDQCEKHRGTNGQTELKLRQLQQTEWALLFDRCFRNAFGIG